MREAIRGLSMGEFQLDDVPPRSSRNLKPGTRRWKCGTQAGVNAHKRTLELLCFECEAFAATGSPVEPMAVQVAPTVKVPRGKYIRKETPVPPDNDCGERAGTTAGDHWHRKWGFPLCDACRLAKNEYSRQRYRECPPLRRRSRKAMP
jgi:hypothetical protein